MTDTVVASSRSRRTPGSPIRRNSGGRFRVPCCIAIAAAFSMLLTASATAQDCSDCEVPLREVVRIGDRDGPGALGRFDAVARADSRGRHFVTWSTTSHILVFDAAGNFIRQVGREGDGPGEFRRPFGIVVGPADSLYVFDNRTNRLTVFDPDLQIARMHNVVHVPGIDLLALDRGGFVMDSDIRTRELAGLPHHVLDAEGGIIASFGSLTREVGPGFQHNLSRVIARGNGGTIWSAHVFRYEITQWDTSNQVLARIRRETDWFPPRQEGRGTNQIRPPEPAVQKIWQADDGSLWVAISVADAEWREAVRQGPRPDTWRVTGPIGYYDTVVEILDPTGRLIGHARLDGVVTGFLRGDRIVVAMEDEDGYPYLSIMAPVNRAR